MRNHISQEDRQYNVIDQKDKEQRQTDLLNTTQKTKDQVPQTLLKAVVVPPKIVCFLFTFT
jgi:hypothetical protein